MDPDAEHQEDHPDLGELRGDARQPLDAFAERVDPAELALRTAGVLLSPLGLGVAVVIWNYLRGDFATNGFLWTGLGIIGVGEGSTVALTKFLHEYLKIGCKRFHEVAQPTWKRE